MRSKYYAVIDTNVIVSALISKTLDSNPVKIIKAITLEQIVPLYGDWIRCHSFVILKNYKIFGLHS